MMNRFFAFFLFFTFSLAVVKGEIDLRDIVYTSPYGGEMCLPFKFAMPKEFILSPSPSKPELCLCEGIYFGDKDAIEKFRQDRMKNPDAVPQIISSGIFEMYYTDGLLPTQLEKSEESENELRKMAKEFGASEVSIDFLKWGVFPVATMLMQFPDRKPIAVMWVYIDPAECLAMTIDYVFPDNQKSYEKNFEIWQHFVYDTATIPLSEFGKLADKFHEDKRFRELLQGKPKA